MAKVKATVMSTRKRVQSQPISPSNKEAMTDLAVEGKSPIAHEEKDQHERDHLSAQN